ncbi:DUF3618 domain-containing protein [Streptomyces uncialis]|uniref:DUF3618 domain-containing protein n=1 Tax=Streptomyces uncialis TaxID=1048205 RepID=UPI0037F492AB
MTERTPSPGDESPLVVKETREQIEQTRIEQTREELGLTVEALTAKADVRSRVREQAAGKAAQLRDAAARAKQLVKEKTPDPVVDRATRTAAQVRNAASRAGELAASGAPGTLPERSGRIAAEAWTHRAPLFGVGAALVVLLVVRRGRRRR